MLTTWILDVILNITLSYSDIIPYWLWHKIYEYYRKLGTVANPFQTLMKILQDASLLNDKKSVYIMKTELK